ncbi:MAG TPA: kelch repeat-containing protein [Candidatus Eisenbacteria bacterium]|nr:kelch repeat-containing protein [Candidatus Eisenbacteria bacterium]
MHARLAAAVRDSVARARGPLSPAAVAARAAAERVAARAVARPGATAAVMDPGEWSPILFPSPFDRYGCGSAYDSRRRRVIEYGGIEQSGPTSVLTGDLWAYDPAAAHWLRLTVAGPAPAARLYASLVYDAADDGLLLFGGWDGHAPLGDAWRLPLSVTPLAWQPLPAGPAARYGQRMVWDGSRGRALVHGGTDGATIFGDLWQLALAPQPAWTQLADVATGGAPVAREFHALVVDPNRDQLVAFGGYDGSFHADVFSLPLAGPYAWIPRAATGAAPSPRDGMNAVYDDARERILLLGGNGDPTGHQLWSLDVADSAAWTQIPGSGDSLGWRFLHDLAYDAGGDQLVLLNGQGLAPGAGATPELGSPETGVWAQGPPAALHPDPAMQAETTPYVDAARDRAIWLSYYHETWALDLASTPPRWTPFDTGPIVSHGGYGYSVAPDPVHDRLLALCGFSDDTGQESDGVVGVSLAGDGPWSPLLAPNPQRLPPGPYLEDGMAVYDARRNRELLWGGTDDYQDYYDDLWALSLGDTLAWSLVPVAGPRPVPRAAAAMFLDAARDRLVLFGGYESGGYYNDLWTLDLAADTLRWQEVAEAVAPSPRANVALTYDAARDRLLLFGGLATQATLGDVWALPLGTLAWQPLAFASAPPPARGDGKWVYDAAHDRALFWGGGRGDLWQLAWPHATPALASLIAADAGPGGVSLRWSVSARGALDLERGSAGGFTRLATLMPDGGGIVSYTDRAVAPGARYDYRLVVPGGAPLPGSDAHVAVPGAAFALAGAVRNPARGPVTARFTLPDAAPARLTLLDVEGRVRAEREVGPLGAGEHTLALAGDLPPGLYLLQLARGDAALTAKVVRLP